MYANSSNKRDTSDKIEKNREQTAKASLTAIVVA